VNYLAVLRAVIATSSFLRVLWNRPCVGASWSQRPNGFNAFPHLSA